MPETTTHAFTTSTSRSSRSSSSSSSGGVGVGGGNIHWVRYNEKACTLHHFIIYPLNHQTTTTNTDIPLIVPPSTMILNLSHDTKKNEYT